MENIFDKPFFLVAVFDDNGYVLNGKRLWCPLWEKSFTSDNGLWLYNRMVETPSLYTGDEELEEEGRVLYYLTAEGYKRITDDNRENMQFAVGFA